MGRVRVGDSALSGCNLDSSTGESALCFIAKRTSADLNTNNQLFSNHIVPSVSVVYFLFPTLHLNLAVFYTEITFSFCYPHKFPR